MVVTPEEEAIQQKPFEVTWTDEESGVAKKAKKVNLRCFQTVQCLRVSRLNELIIFVEIDPFKRDSSSRAGGCRASR